MLKMLKSVPILATVMSAGLMSGQAARADHVDVDIDRLKAEIRQDYSRWRGFVDYKSEIEDVQHFAEHIQRAFGVVPTPYQRVGGTLIRQILGSRNPREHARIKRRDRSRRGQ